MLKDNYQFRYIMYSKYNKKNCEDMLKFDRKRFPGGCMVGYIIWIVGKWKEFDKSTNNKYKIRGIKVHEKFDKFLSKIIEKST